MNRPPVMFEPPICFYCLAPMRPRMDYSHEHETDIADQRVWHIVIEYVCSDCGSVDQRQTFVMGNQYQWSLA